MKQFCSLEKSLYCTTQTAHFVPAETFWFSIALAGAAKSVGTEGPSSSSSRSSGGTDSDTCSEAVLPRGGGGSRKCAPPPPKISSTSVARRSITVFPNRPLLAPAVSAKTFISGSNENLKQWSNNGDY